MLSLQLFLTGHTLLLIVKKVSVRRVLDRDIALEHILGVVDKAYPEGTGGHKNMDLILSPFLFRPTHSACANGRPLTEKTKPPVVKL